MKKINQNLLSLEITQIISMAEQYFAEVVDKYELYQDLVQGRKITSSEIITLSKVGNNDKILESSVPVSHHAGYEDGFSLMVEVNKKNQGNFKFKLIYNSFIPAPFFRFDSIGKTHWVKIDGIKLNHQQITTPHFHKFNELGVEIAYKTEKLNDPQEAKALEDIDLCLAHFCHESNLRLNDEDFPTVEIMPQTLGLHTYDDDPNQNVDF